MNMQNSIIHLGKIKWFGGYSYQKGNYNQFGFIIENVYFNASVFVSPNVDTYIQSGLENVPAFYTLKQEDNVRAGAGWVKLVSEITEEELLDLYRKNDSVRQILNNLDNYLSLMQYQGMGAVFVDVLRNVGLPAMLAGIKNFNDLPSFVYSFTLPNIPWNELTNEEAIELFLFMPESWKGKAEILKSIYPAWIDDTRVVEKLKSEYFPDCISSGIENNDYDTIAKLFKNVSDKNIKQKIASFLPIERFLSDVEYCRALTDEKITESILEYFSNDYGNETKDIAALISTVDPFDKPKAAIALGKQLLERNLPLSVWKLLSNPEKVWFVLYLSLHLDKVASWKEPFGEIYIYEHKTIDVKSPSVLAAIDFLTIALVVDSKKQGIFEKAHQSLEQAIIRDFENAGCPSHELMQLICRCKTNRFAVCAASYWKREDTAWCSTERGSCNRFDKPGEAGIDYRKTNYEYCVEYNDETALCKLSIADLLNVVGFKPVLVNVYNPMLGRTWEFDEYPYRIGGRIQQMNRFFAHMHCRCGKTMKSNYAFSVKINARMAITRAYCPDAETKGSTDHDPNVYLNECWNCDEVIDSRDCKFKQVSDGTYYPAAQEDINGYYVCMNCGAGLKDVLPAICPACGCKDQDSLEYIIIKKDPLKRRFAKCKACGYSSNSWVSEFEKSKHDKSESVPEVPFNLDEFIYCDEVIE